LISSLLKLVPISVSLGLVSLSLVGSDAATFKKQDKAPVDYARVDAIFRNYHCVDCHNDSERPAAKLSLTTYEGLMAGGRSGDTVVAGKSADSLLIKAVSHHGGPAMPPGGSGLKPDEIATLVQWVDEGANTSEYGHALTRYHDDMAKSKWDDALKACDEIEAMKIESVPTGDIADRSRLPIYVATKDEKGWYTTANKAVEIKPLDTGMLNDIAWTIVDPQGWIKIKDLDLAMKAATLAVEDSKRTSGAVLDTLAWVHFLKGDKTEAIKIEKEAMACSDAQGATLDSLKESMKAFGG
jgi:hypothetical protein